MSNPAIVLMTDPTRCSLGDVQHLLQALLEMQHMGEHARPQAFCDHPAAAEGFIAAYAEAYPKLVLQDGAIPTPDYLQSLIAQGQMGAFGQPLRGAIDGLPQPNGPSRSFEQAGSISFPIVVLTLGTSQVLADAMQQSPAMRDSIRLIDVAPDGAESAPVSIAEAVGGLDGERAWDSGGLEAPRSELDEVAGATIADPGDSTLDRDSMDLDVVETAEAAGAEASAYHEQAEEEAAAAEPKAVEAAEPAEPAVASQTQVAEEAFEPSPATEPVIPSADAVWTANADLALPLAAEDDADDLVFEDEPADGGDAGDHSEAQQPKGDGEVEDPPADKGSKEDGDLQAVLERGTLGDGDVAYPAVGSLIAGADVHYPALEQAAAQSALQELAAVMMDDAIFDADLVAPALQAGSEDVLPGRAPEHEAGMRHEGNVVTIEDLYDAFDDESEDAFGDSGVGKPAHDTDL